MADTKKVNYELRAEDKFSAVFDKLKGRLTDTEGHFSRMKGVVAGAFAGVSVAGMIAMVKSVTDAGDEAFKMAQKVGMGVEAWQKLVYVAKLADVAQESLAKGIKGLSVNIMEAVDGSDKATDLFKRLGVAIKDVHGNVRPTEQILLDLADVFVTLKDGPLKTALAVQTFGKAGMELIPMLNQGRDGIEALMKEAERLGIVMDAKTAAASEALNDSFTRLSAATRGMWVQAIAPLVPFLEKMADSFFRSRTEGDKLANSSKMIETGLKLLGSVAIVVKGTFEAIGTLIGGIAASWVAWVNLNPAATMDILKRTLGDVATVTDRNKQLLHDLWNGVATEAPKASAGIRDFGGSALKSKSAIEDLTTSLEKELAKLRGAFSNEQKVQEVLIELAKDKYSKITKGERDRVLALAKSIDAEREYLEKAKAMVAAEQAMIDGWKQQRAAVDEFIGVLRESNKDLQLEADAVGKTTEQRELMVLALEKERKLRGNVSEAQKKIIEDLYAERAAIIATKAEREGQLNLWTEIADRGSRAFADLVTSGKSAFDTLKNMLRDFAKELLALFAKRWILQLAASATGSASLGAAAQSAGANTLAGSALGSLGTAASGVASWVGSTQVGADFIAGFNAAGGAMGVSSSASAMTQLGNAIGQVVPYLWYFGIALAGAAVAAGQYARGWRIDGPGNDPGRFNIASPMWTASAMDRTYRALGFNDQWAAILSGSSFAARMFGHQARQPTGLGVRGTIGSDSFQGENWMDWIERGGWFRSDRTGSAAPVPFDSQQQAFFTAMLKGISDITSTLATRLGVDRSSVLAGYSRDFNLDFKDKKDDEIATMLNDMFASVLREQMITLLDAGGRHGLSAYLKGVTGSAEDISRAVEAVMSLVDAMASLDDAIAMLEGGPVEALNQQLHAMNQAVDKGREALAAAIAANDPAQVLAAEQQVTQAIMQRYQSEISMVRQLQEAIRQTEEEAYQFALNIASRINSVGGSRDIAAIAMSRAQTLQGRIGTGPIGYQIEDLQGYVGAIDTWYQARRAAIEQQMANEKAAAQAIAQQQADAAQARVTQLQNELQMVNEFQQVVDRTRQMMDDMRLSTANPLSAGGRLGLAREDVARLREEYESSSGSARVAAANHLLDALQNMRSLGQEAFQRPSPEWQSLYNEIMSELTSVQDDAKSVAERGVDLQEQLLAAQGEANRLSAAVANAGQASSAALDALNQEALGYYTYAETQGDALYTLQRQQHQEQLAAITGGTEPELFIAARTAEMVAELRGVRSDINAWMNGVSQGGGGGAPGGEGGSTLTINVQSSGGGAQVDTQAVVKAVQAAAPTIRRILVRS